ncbi:MAG: ABC transporter ATP-binding protein [Bacillota bacterium]|jgi:ATP-binding cassette subfamily B multidrug efflux pump|nr:ABC transporter ATP-binding protein [Candidatus Fermentithermobacillaceae bacterium]
MSEYDLDLEEDVEERPFNREHFARILSYARPYPKTVVAATALTLTGIVLGLVEPLMFRAALDHGIATKDWRVLGTILSGILILRVLALVISRAQIKTTNYLGQRVLFDLRQGLFEHVEHLPFSFFDHRPAGKIISRITNDVNHIGNLAASGVINVVSQMISLVGIIVIMMSLHWRMAALSFTTIPFLALVLTKLRWALQSAWGDTRKAVADINAHLNETIQGLQVIQAFGRESSNSMKFDRANRKFFGAYMRAVRLDQAFWPLADIVGAAGTCIVIWYGAKEYLAGSVTLGLMLAFTNYLGKFWAPISTFSRVWSQILSAMASAERVFGILDLKTESDESEEAVRAASLGEAPKLEIMPPIEGRVVFDHVTFGYRAAEPVLHDVSFTVEPGETIALVGPTGAGKTTIINLLARFYLPTAGRVLVDGRDLMTVDLPSYRKQMGTVLQDTFIFSGTIMDNLRFGKLDATQEEVERAVEAACARGFIEDMPGGFQAEVKERGTNLSSGQRQLLAFARAILADPRILILDEATSSVDPETERLIQQAMKALLAGRTSFIIAHRLSTVRAADRIMVIEDGKIAEEGTHDELVEAQGKYASLYEAQFKAQENRVMPAGRKKPSP